MQVMYLYGFASGPLSEKAQFFKEKFNLAGIIFQIIDYIPNSNAFTQMKPSILIKSVEKFINDHHLPGEDLILFGSSFGGLMAAWYSYLNSENVSKLILIAPALHFTPTFISHNLGTKPQKWKKDGFIGVDHYRYNKRVPLNYTFLQDLQSFPPPKFQSDSLLIPTYIFHGINDEVIPLKWSLDFANQNSKISVFPLDGDHQLLDRKEEMWMKIKGIIENVK